MVTRDRSVRERALVLLFVCAGLLTLALVPSSGASYTGSRSASEQWSTTSANYGCELGGTVVKAVQKGTSSIGGGGSPAGPATFSVTATITAVDTGKAFLMFTTASPGNGIIPGAVVVRGELTNSTTVTFTRETSEAAPVQMDVAWTVVEYACGVSVQRGSVLVNALTTNVALVAVDTSRAFVLWSKTPKNTDTGWNADDAALVELTSSTNLRISTAQAPTGHMFSWQVVEFTVAGAAAVQRGTTTAFNNTSASSTAVTVASASDPSRSFVLVDVLHSLAFGAEGPRLISGRLTSSTSLVLERDTAASALLDVAWQVVTLNEGSYVQTGSVDATGASTTATWNATDASRTNVIAAGQLGFGQGVGRSTGTVGSGQARLTTTSTTVTVTRTSTATGASFEVFRIEWGGPGSTWNSGYGLRRRIVVSATNSGGLPTGYSVPVTLDHAAAVAGSTSVASGDDVRVAHFDGSVWTELDRVLGDGSSWNQASTTLWFKTSAAVAASANTALATDGEYWLYTGNPSAAGPPSSASSVYLFADDFESGNLAKWTQPVAAGAFTASTDRAHRGTYSVRLNAITNSLRLLKASGVNTAGVALSAYWYLTSPYATDYVGFAVRDTTTNGSTITNHSAGFLNSGGLGWNLSHFSNSTYGEDANAAAQTVTADSWVRMTLELQPASGTQQANGIRVLKNGAALNPSSGYVTVTPVAASGSISLSTYNVPGGSLVYVDDIIARSLVVPEPTAATGTVQRV